MIDDVMKDDITYASTPTKIEAGTMQTAELVAFAEAIKFIENLGIENIEEYENSILEYGIEKFKRNNSVKIIGNPRNRGSVMSFTIKGIHPHDIAAILDDDGVAIRAGHHCCQILHDKLGIPATARASIGVYNTKEDIDILCKAIENCKKVFQG
jgi:cysteine desulfurase/selenocysteine lyase